MWGALRKIVEIYYVEVSAMSEVGWNLEFDEEGWTFTGCSSETILDTVLRWCVRAQSWNTLCVTKNTSINLLVDVCFGLLSKSFRFYYLVG